MPLRPGSGFHKGARLRFGEVAERWDQCRRYGHDGTLRWRNAIVHAAGTGIGKSGAGRAFGHLCRWLPRLLASHGMCRFYWTHTDGDHGAAHSNGTNSTVSTNGNAIVRIV